ncbi:outer membrane lipoprotein carrier protein LolA [Chakrabartia godavariana]|nr:outer membrane lipoprotein carrier protein LolA [Chakrabartia godavariana]
MKFALPLSAATALALTAAAPAPAQSGSLAAVSAHLKAVTTMTADFTQTDRAGKTVAGTLSLKRPGKVRFQYQKGVPILIVGDGKALTFIDYSVRQVQRWPIGSTPLGVLLNPDRDLTSIAKLVPAANPRITLVEARDKKHPEYGVITLAFSKNDSAPAGLMLEGWVSIDSQNNRTTVRLSNQRFNGPISDKTFNWSDPRPKGPRG